MAFTIRKTDKRSGITYVYESESYWDKEKKQPRSRRKLIGKIDAETGEIVPTGRKASKEGGQADAELRARCNGLESAIREKDAEITALRAQVSELTAAASSYKEKLRKISEIARG